jgi:diacylglycerol kinase family enzyme
VALGEDLGAGVGTMQLETMQMRTRATSTVRSIRPRGSGPIQIVATPGSGNGAAAAMAARLSEALSARGHEVRLDIFPRLQALQRWAATDPSRISHLISVGGDGTQSAVAMAAARRSVPFLPVPAGFGNLFARAFRLGSRVEDVIDRLEHGEIVRADVGLQNGEPFLCHASFGLVSEVQARVEAGRYPQVRWRRRVEYYRTAVRHLRETPLAVLRVVVDGRVVTDDVVLVTVANVETYGPWLRLTLAASPVDGLFDTENASPALTAQPNAPNAPALAPSNAPRLAGTKKVAKRTPDPRASITVATTSEAGRPSAARMRNASTAPISQPTKWKAAETRKDRHSRR